MNFHFFLAVSQLTIFVSNLFFVKHNAKKRHVDDSPSHSDESENDAPQTKKQKAPKKTQKGKSKCVDAAVPAKKGKTRFQQTFRCSIGEVIAAAKLLKEAHRSKVTEARFGCVFQWVLEGNVSRILMCYLMMIIDTDTMKIDCGAGKQLVVNSEAVHQVFGFPIGGDIAPRPSDNGHDESLQILKEQLGFDSKASIDTKHLRSLLERLVENPEKVDEAVQVFFAILYNKLICPGSAVRLGREAPMLINLDYKKMASMDFCQVVVDEIKRFAIKYQNRSIPQAGPKGCGLQLSVMYLDSCYSPKFSVMHTDIPRANFLHEDVLEKIYKLDILKKGKGVLSDYKFGKLGVSF